MKAILFILFTLLSAVSFAQNALYCDEIKRIRTWAHGSDTYNVWFEYKNNPSSCTGGFYMKTNAINRDFVYSLALSAKAKNERVCIQANPSASVIGNRCLLNYIMHE